jgi:hypothetical protein
MFCFSLCLLAIACGDKAVRPQDNGETSGISECDAYLQAACTCAKTLPAASESCRLATQAKASWRSTLSVPVQLEAAKKACVDAKAALDVLACKP